MNWENVFVFVVVLAICAGWFGLLLLFSGINIFG